MSELTSPADESGGEMAAHDNVSPKRHRRPSVRLGDIGGAGADADAAGDHSSFGQRRVLKNNKASKDNRHRTNLSSNQTVTLVHSNPSEKFKNWTNVEEDEDDVAIGSWKIRNLKSKKGAITKKMRTGWTPKANAKMLVLTTDVEEDLENNENNSVHSPDKTNDIDIARRIGNVNSSRKRATRVSEGDPTDTEARDLNVASERDGIKVWLNQLGLGRYASLFEIHEVDDEVLPMLTLEDLKDMGISAVGSRRKMYCSIQNLNKGFS